MFVTVLALQRSQVPKFSDIGSDDRSIKRDGRKLRQIQAELEAGVPPSWTLRGPGIPPGPSHSEEQNAMTPARRWGYDCARAYFSVQAKAQMPVVTQFDRC